MIINVMYSDTLLVYQTIDRVTRFVDKENSFILYTKKGKKKNKLIFSKPEFTPEFVAFLA